MADMPYTACFTPAHPSAGDLSPFTVSGFASLTAALRDAVLAEHALDWSRVGGGADDLALQHRAASAWCRTEAVASRFLRAHAGVTGTAVAALAETADRILAVVTLDGLEERGELFGLVADTMLVRTRVPAGSEACLLIGEAIPWMYQAAQTHAVLLPDPGPDDARCDPQAEPAWTVVAVDGHLAAADGVDGMADLHPI